MPECKWLMEERLAWPDSKNRSWHQLELDWYRELHHHWWLTSTKNTSKVKFTKSVWITGYYDAISFAFASAVLHVSVSSSHTAVRPSCPLVNFTVNWKSKDGCSLWKFSKWINPIDCIYQTESILCNMGGEHSFTTLKDYVREVWLAQKWNNVILIYSKVLTRGQSPPSPHSLSKTKQATQGTRAGNMGKQVPYAKWQVPPGMWLLCQTKLIPGTLL